MVIKYHITCLIKVTLIKEMLKLKHKYCSLGQADIIISVSLAICDTTSEKLVSREMLLRKKINKEKEPMFVCMLGFDIIRILVVLHYKGTR